MSSSETPAKARKGDLVLVEEVSRNYYSVSAAQEARAAGRELPETTTTYQFGIVASATRDGQVKTWRHLGSSGYAPDLGSQQRRWVTPVKEIDVEAVLTTAKRHRYPNSDTPMPFTSLKDAVDVARPFLRRPAEVS